MQFLNITKISHSRNADNNNRNSHDGTLLINATCFRSL